MKKRVGRALRKLKEKNLDALLVARPANCAYLSGFRGQGLLILSPRGNFLVASSIYREEAGALKGGFFPVIVSRGKSLLSEVAGVLRRRNFRRVGFEDSVFSYRDFKRLRNLTRSRLVATANLVENLRCLKDRREIGLIRTAGRLAGRAMDYARSFIEPGITEEAARRKIESFISSLPDSRPAFPSFVASGPDAGRPHHCPGKRKIEKGELVVVDLGVNYRGYNSDLTRTFFFGKLNTVDREILTLVLEAERLGQSSLKPGIRASQLDRQVRTFLTAQGWGKFFTHNLGHGVGMEVHEAPLISAARHDLLLPGMVITIEPGIYLPGKSGCRWEDMALVTKKGSEALT